MVMVMVMVSNMMKCRETRQDEVRRSSECYRPFDVKNDGDDDDWILYNGDDDYDYDDLG